jgi:hypothetical protein
MYVTFSDTNIGPYIEMVVLLSVTSWSPTVTAREILETSNWQSRQRLRGNLDTLPPSIACTSRVQEGWVFVQQVKKKQKQHLSRHSSGLQI